MKEAAAGSHGAVSGQYCTHVKEAKKKSLEKAL
jgi:hypothetical protein